jgi:hypothetical protein
LVPRASTVPALGGSVRRFDATIFLEFNDFFWIAIKLPSLLVTINNRNP